MEKKYRLIIVIVLLLIANPGFSQQVLIENDDMNHTILKSFDLRARDIQGSSYLNENFLPAKINDIDRLFSMRFDAYIDEMEIDIDGKYFHLPKDAEFKITFDGLGKTYVLNSYAGEKGTERGYFVIAYLGNEVSLLVKERIKYFKEVPQKLGFVEYQPPKLKRVNDELYFGFSNNSAQKVPKKKKDVLKLFSSNAKKIEAFAKEQNLGFKSEEDLKQLLEYYSILN